MLGKHKAPLFVLPRSALTVKKKKACKKANLVIKRSNNIASQNRGDKKKKNVRRIVLQCCTSFVVLLQRNNCEKTHLLFCFHWFQVDVFYPNLLGRVRHIFQNIISTTKLESARSLYTVVAWETQTVLKPSPTAMTHALVSVLLFLFSLLIY